MCRNVKNPHSFDFPVDHLLRFWSSITIEEMHNPKMLNQNGPYMVLKHEITTDLTVESTNNILSYTCYYGVVQLLMSPRSGQFCLLTTMPHSQTMGLTGMGLDSNN